MSGDGYFRHKITMEIGTKKNVGRDQQIKKRSFKDDREFLAYLLEQERLDEQIASASFTPVLRVK